MSLSSKSQVGTKEICIKSGIMGRKQPRAECFTFDIELIFMRHPINLLSRALGSLKCKELTWAGLTSRSGRWEAFSFKAQAGETQGVKSLSLLTKT